MGGRVGWVGAEGVVDRSEARRAVCRQASKALVLSRVLRNLLGSFSWFLGGGGQAGRREQSLLSSFSGSFFEVVF